MSTHKQRGFTLVELLLSIIAIALVAFVGFYIQDRHKTTATVSQTPTASRASEPKTTEADPTATWTAATSPDGAFSFRYPNTWFKNTCEANTILLGPTEASAGRCQSDGTPEIYLTSNAGDSRNDNKLTPDNYTDITNEAITVNGVSGTKQTGTIQMAGDQFVGPVNSSKVISYVFYHDGKTFTAQYTQTPSFSDVSSDFNLLVTKTLHFAK